MGITLVTREYGQAIRVGDDIKVTVLGISKAKARIGIDAPKELEIRKEETDKRVKAGSGKSGGIISAGGAGTGDE